MRVLETSMALVFGLVASLAFAQMGSQNMGQGMHQGMRARLYDPSTVTTVKGTVTDVEVNSMGSMMNQQGTKMGQQGGMMNQHPAMSRMTHKGWMGTHLTLKIENGFLDVILGPSSYITEKNFTFVKGDQIEVTGSKVTRNGQQELIARSVKKGNKTLTLRNDQGIPLWSRNRQQAKSNAGS